MKNIEIIRAYTAAEKSLEDTNAALKENGKTYKVRGTELVEP